MLYPFSLVGVLPVPVLRLARDSDLADTVGMTGWTCHMNTGQGRIAHTFKPRIVTVTRNSPYARSQCRVGQVKGGM
jgi:hypothetical protein